MATLLCLAGTAAWAQQEEAVQSLKDCVSAYAAADFMAALQQCKAAAEMEEAQRATRAEAFVYLGVVYYSLRERGDTVLAFKQALEQDPTFRMKEGEFSPEVVEIFNKVRAAWVTDLKVVSSPAKTPVSIDGVRKGETPLVATELFKKICLVKLERPRYQPVEETVDLRQKNSLFVDLQEECGVRDITLIGMKAGSPQERVSTRSDAIVLTLTYTGCTDDTGRIRKVEFRDLSIGEIREVMSVFLPQESGVIEVVRRAPPLGWQPGRFEYRVRALEAAEEEQGISAQFVIER